MRVVTGLDGSKDLRQAEIDRHAEVMSRFVESVQGQILSREMRTLTLILRSATSDPAQALISMKDEFLRASLGAKVILAKLQPEDAMQQLFGCLSELRPSEPANELIRWAKNPRLLDAHEQVTYGVSMCWSGDAMRRDAGKRNALALFDEHAADPVKLARRSFEALWTASVLVPHARLLGTAIVRPSGAYETLNKDSLVPSPLRPGPQGWPLVRH